MRRLLRYIRLSLATLVMMALLLILWIGYTQPGLHLSIKLLQTFLPGELTMTRAQGQLFHKIKFDRLSYQQDGLELTIDDLQMHWQPYTGLWRELSVQNLNINQIDMKQTANDSASSTDLWELLDFELPFTVNLNRVDIQSIHWQSDDDADATTIEQLQLTLQATRHEIHHLNLSVIARQHNITARGKIHWRPPFESDLHILVKPQAQASPAINGQLAIKGHFDAVTFDLTIDNPWTIQVKGTIDDQWDVKWHADVDRINSQGHITGERAHPVFNAHSQARQLSIGDVFAEQLGLRSHYEWGMQGAFDNELVIDGLEIGQTRVDRLQLLLKGVASNHQFKIQVAQAAEQWQSVIDGQYLNDTWQGHIAFVNYKDRDGKLWKIDSVGTLSIAPWTTPATARLTVPQLRWLNSFFPDNITQADGQIHAEFELVDKKTFDWNALLTLKQADLTLTSSNITLQDIQLAAKKSVNTPWQFNGEVTSGEGRLILSTDPEKAAIKLSGENFTLFDTDELFMTLSPELSLSRQDELIEITGTIRIPKAHIKPVDYSNAIELPSDVVFVKPHEQNSSPMKWRAHIDVILGDEIAFDYLGLSTSLTGQLTVTEVTGQPTYATGQIDLIDGKIHYLNQTLQLDYGHIHYTNALIDEPTLRMRASKKITTTISQFSIASQETIVGIKVEGKLPDPKVSLFSIPSGMSESDILSLMILGKTISQASSGLDNKENSERLIQASAALGLTSSPAVEQIRDAFGIDQLSLETEKQTQAGGGVMEQTSLVVGKAITPRLFVSYHINLLGQQNRFSGNIVRFRYLLRPKLILQTQTDGNDNSVDLLYIIERK